MNHSSFMFVAGEPSGDALGAELVHSLRSRLREQGLSPRDGSEPSFGPTFFGAGGQHMKDGGVDVVVDMTAHSAIGISDVLKKLVTFHRLLRQLSALAERRQPDAIVCVDFSGFNRRLGHAIKQRVRSRGSGWFHQWSPKLIQYVSPQVWASRPRRAILMREDFDLVLSIFPFEQGWYARNAPGLKVSFVGHPIVDRYPLSSLPQRAVISNPNKACVLLLPGSRSAELRRHLPALYGALKIIQNRFPGVEAAVVVPNTDLGSLARNMGAPSSVQIKIGDLPEHLMKADLALASTGTVTMECAWFGVPTIAFYRTSWSTYQIGRRIVKVRYLAMPNILADEPLFPEFIQHEATADNIGRCALDLLAAPARLTGIKTKLRQVCSTLGEPGAADRAAREILDLL